MVNYWVVRLGSGGEFTEHGKEGRYIAIGWTGIKDLTKINEIQEPADVKHELTKTYRNAYPSDNPRQRSKGIGQIFAFMRSIKNEDYVLVPNQSTRTVLIGVIKSGYYYQKNKDDFRYRHRREVKWINEVNRDDISQSLRYSIGALPTVFQIKGHEKELTAVIGGKPFEAPLKPNYDSKPGEGTLLGEPINFRGIVYAPVNEQGVVFLFSKVSQDLNMEIELIQTGFPDAIALVKTKKGYARRTVEFEYKSSNYNHLPGKSDFLVCWEQDWMDCPRDMEVIELKEVITGLKPHD